MNWQELIVGLIGLLVAVIVVRWVVRTLLGRNSGGGCNCSEQCPHKGTKGAKAEERICRK